MLANRVQSSIRSILQNSKLNREKFVNNKKKYNMTTVKNRNHNMVIKRKFCSSSGFTPPNKNPKPFNEALIAFLVTYTVGDLILKML